MGCIWLQGGNLQLSLLPFDCNRQRLVANPALTVATLLNGLARNLVILGYCVEALAGLYALLYLRPINLRWLLLTHDLPLQ